MELVVMPINANIKVETKDVYFFDEEDIEKFTTECCRRNNCGTIKYRYGYVYASNIYMGLRIGELLALKWEDIDFEKKTVYVCKTIIEQKNPEYDENNPFLMKQMGIHKTRQVVQNSTKRNKNRYVPLNQSALNYLKMYYKECQYKSPDDYVICSKNKKIITIKNASESIRMIEENAETKVKYYGTHILRHTCASLYFKKGIPIETICTILGNTREVCEKTYVHFMEDQLQDAAQRISDSQLLD